MGAWTKRLIPCVRAWFEQNVQVDHYTTQFLTGHGCFYQYLKRIGVVEDASCRRCLTGEKDTAEHILRCSRWEEELKDLKQLLGGELTTERMAMHMERGKWPELQQHLLKIMKVKVEQDRVGRRR